MKIKKILFFILNVLIITTAYGDQQYFCYPDEDECEEATPCCEIPAIPAVCAYNHPARINVCGNLDFFITGIFLYWNLRQEQMEFAYTDYTSEGTSATSNINYFHKLNFEWKPAFIVGLGYNFNYDNWTGYIQYTRICSTMNDKASLGNTLNEILFDIWDITLPQENTLTEVKVKWKLNFNIFDIELSRSYYNGLHLIFQSYYGLKSGWINQIYKCENIDTSLNVKAQGTFKSNSWLLGPRTGIKTKWFFNENFKFLGNIAASLFYQKFYKITNRQPDVSNPNLWALAENLSQSLINSSIEMLTGFGWETYFNRNNNHFDLTLGYDFQIYFNQNLIKYLEFFAETKPGNLMFHGLNITMQFNF